MDELPETILQFGSGRFLRGFADLFIHHGNSAGQAIGRVVVLQSTGTGRAEGLNDSHGKYPVLVRGFADGKIIDSVERCGSISRALTVGCHWAELLDVARSPHLHTILSNTTEAGYACGEAENPLEGVPSSFPGKLFAVLRARWMAGLPGVTVIPCELIEGNAAILREIVCKLAVHWDVACEGYLREDCVWLHTLVDRIVTMPPRDHAVSEHPMAVAAEPFSFWALEDHPRSQFKLDHPAITRTTDVLPYFLRKVRILNAAHTALVIKAVPQGYQFVREAMADPGLECWLRDLLDSEVVPTIADRVEGATLFAKQTIERFKNPFADHKFADIALHHAEKIRVRLIPTALEYRTKFGAPAPLLSKLLDEAGVDVPRQ